MVAEDLWVPDARAPFSRLSNTNASRLDWSLLDRADFVVSALVVRAYRDATLQMPYLRIFRIR